MYHASKLFDIYDDLGITNTSVATWISRIVALIILWSFVYVLVRYLSRWIKRVADQTEHLHISDRDLKTVDRLFDYTVVLIALIVSLAILDWTSLLYSALTAAGVFTVIIGFAVKDVAANFISGVFILIDRPFAVGDFIKVGDNTGVVESISLRTTCLVSVDGPMIHIPNSVVAVQPTTNYTTAQDRRINFNISIANEADIGQAIEVIEQLLASEEGLLPERAQLVLVNEVREYAVDLMIMCYAPTDTFFTIASDLKRQVTAALQQSGVELAVPTRKYVNVGSPVAQDQVESRE